MDTTQPLAQLTPADPYCATCGRPADAHTTRLQQCPEQHGAGLLTTYRPQS